MRRATRGGGQILVGGDYQGKNRGVQNAQATFVGPDATLRADAASIRRRRPHHRLGRRRDAFVRRDLARAAARRAATAASSRRRATFISTSRARRTSARRAGRGGNWLIDPGEVLITQGGANNNISASPTFTPSPTANATSRLTTATLNTAIDNNANVSISTGTTAGGASGNIIFDASAGMGGNLLIRKQPGAVLNSTLTLNAANDIIFTGGTTTIQTETVRQYAEPGRAVQPGAERRR